MAINPAFLKCAVCNTSHATPFDFHRTPDQQAEVDRIRAERRAQAERGWTGRQHYRHATRVLLCDAHQARADELGLSAVPIADGLAQLRGEA